MVAEVAATADDVTPVGATQLGVAKIVTASIAQLSPLSERNLKPTYNVETFPAPAGNVSVFSFQAAVPAVKLASCRGNNDPAFVHVEPSVEY